METRACWRTRYSILPLLSSTCFKTHYSSVLPGIGLRTSAQRTIRHSAPFCHQNTSKCHMPASTGLQPTNREHAQQHSAYDFAY
jgi:hypothetical protein